MEFSERDNYRRRQRIMSLSDVVAVIFTGGSFAEFWDALMKMFGLEHLGQLVNWIKGNM